MFARIDEIQIGHLCAVIPRDRRLINEMDAFPDKVALKRAMKSTGVEEVRYAGKNQTAADLCLEAAENIFAVSDIAKPECIIFVSSTPDYLSTATSPILQDKLGLGQSTLCFDINYGCSGFVYGLLQAALVLSAMPAVESVLVLTGETASKTIDPADSSTALIFGDAGTAAIVRRRPGGGKTPFFTQTDGSGFATILKPTGGYRQLEGQSYLHMDGAKVLEFVMASYQPSIAEFLKLAEVDVGAVPRFYFHQANKLILDYIANKTGLPKANVPTSYAKFGNTGGGALPLTIAMDLKANPGRQSASSFISGFGVGLSWGHTLSNLSDCVSLGVVESRN